MRSGATSDNPVIRKKMFVEYFDRFSEFPSYLFDNNSAIDPQLLETIQDLEKDLDTSEKMHKGITELLSRLPGRPASA